jgi:hypothetical protein
MDEAYLNLDRYPLPDVPKGWAPDPRRVWDNDKNKENIQKPSHPGKWKSEISAEQVRFLTCLLRTRPNPDYIERFYARRSPSSIRTEVRF